MEERRVYYRMAKRDPKPAPSPRFKVQASRDPFEPWITVSVVDDLELARRLAKMLRLVFDDTRIRRVKKVPNDGR